MNASASSGLLSQIRASAGSRAGDIAYMAACRLLCALGYTSFGFVVVAADAPKLADVIHRHGSLNHATSDPARVAACRADVERHLRDLLHLGSRDPVRFLDTIHGCGCTFATLTAAQRRDGRLLGWMARTRTPGALEAAASLLATHAHPPEHVRTLVETLLEGPAADR